MRHALVTGGGAGLGAAIVAALLGAGYRVSVLDRTVDLARQAADHPNAAAFGADVGDEAAVEAVFEALDGVPDLIVNNAGIVRFGPLIEQSVEDFRTVVTVNLVGTYIVARAAARRMVAAGRAGHILNFSSINALTPGPNAGAYPAAKAGVSQFTRHLAVELGPLGIRVNCIAPGFIDAGMSAPIYADPVVRARRASGVPLRALGTADDIAQAVLFLDSPNAGYITGHELVVDGGVVHSLLAQLRREA
jgi:NAD(P)-dependent dehydrogenase (short-subunit alcohol dehydrogenase family)